MNKKDVWGHSVSGATAAALPHYAKSLAEFRCYVGDPVASVEAALTEAPDFVMAYCLKAYLFLSGTEPMGVAPAREAYEHARRKPTDERERQHLSAIAALLDGEYDLAVERLEDILLAYPRDLLALQMAHVFDFFRGDSRNLRDRVARVRPEWTRDDVGCHAVLGMHAFGLEECGAYAAAEEAGRAAVEIEPRDTWAHHAVTHVMEMQGRVEHGIEWITSREQHWAPGSGLAVHNWWHLALFHLDRDEYSKVLDLYDRPIRGGKSPIVLEMIDASAMLWRLQLRGIDVGNRWDELADSWEPLAESALYAFNDFHATMAFLGAGRRDLISTTLKTMTRRLEQGGSNQAMTRDVGLPACHALVAFDRGDYSTAVSLLRPLRWKAARFGGSHAQRDIIDLTLIEAARRGGEVGVLRAMAHERIAVRPASPIARRYRDQARALAPRSVAA